MHNAPNFIKTAVKHMLEWLAEAEKMFNLWCFICLRFFLFSKDNFVTSVRSGMYGYVTAAFSMLGCLWFIRPINACLKWRTARIFFGEIYFYYILTVHSM